jgi:hypothetical protein
LGPRSSEASKEARNCSMRGAAHSENGLLANAGLKIGEMRDFIIPLKHNGDIQRNSPTATAFRTN